jgi:adenylate cyclase
VIVGTYRDHELDPAGPLAKCLDLLTRLHLLDRVNLLGLPEDGVAAMIRDLSGHYPSPAVLRFISANTDGNPFFVEELFHHLSERGGLFDSNGEFRTDFAPRASEIPKSVKLVIERRLTRLTIETQRMLGMAAAIGRFFSFQLLEAVTGVDADTLLDRVEEAEREGIIVSTLEYKDARFHFPHELVRQVVHSGLSTPRRQRIHLLIADGIERLYSDSVENHANDLAYHLAQAGAAADDPARIVRYLAMAARREISQSAYESASHHLKNALELVPKLPPGPDRNRIELDLLIDYGVTLLFLKGWYLSEIGDVYGRARVLCAETGEKERLLPVLFGLCSFHICRAELKLARQYLEEMSALAPDSDDKTVLTSWLMGDAQFFLGEFAAAHASFELGVRSYDKRKHRSLAHRVGQDTCVSCLGYDAMCLLIMGFPDQAEKRMEECLALARELGYPFTLTLGLNTAANYYCIRRDISRLPPIVEEATALAREHGFALYEDSITAFEIIGLAHEGRVEELKARLNAVGENPSGARYELALSWVSSTLAEGLGNLGRMKRAVALLAVAFALLARNDERYVEAEIHRIQGALLLKQTEGPAGARLELQTARIKAETSFRNAREIARRQGAKLFELRAAICLSQLLIQVGRAAEAGPLLGETYRTFTEGFDTPDLRAARAILDTLRPLA